MNQNEEQRNNREVDEVASAPRASRPNTEVDETLLLVKGTQNDKRLNKEYVKKLSNALFQVYKKHGLAKFRCVGAGSVNHAIKAWINTKREIVKEEGHINLILDGDYTNVDFDGVEKTGIILIVRPEGETE